MDFLDIDEWVEGNAGVIQAAIPACCIQQNAALPGTIQLE